MLSVGICTAGRPHQLGRLLARLPVVSAIRQDPRSVTVVVVDNSPDGSARDVVARFEAGSPISVVYRHVPEKGLSNARNALLDTAAGLGELLAFIDDDELPEPEWLGELLRVYRKSGAPIVTGPVLPRFGQDAPDWLRRGGFLDLAVHPDGAQVREAISGNALLHLPSISAAGLRFDSRMNRTGGEDQVFFRQARSAGIDIRFAAGATVFESVPGARTTLHYLLRREMQKGNALGLLARYHPELGETRIWRLLAACKWSLAGASTIVLGTFSGRSVPFRRGVLQMTRAAGMIGGLVGWQFFAY